MSDESELFEAVYDGLPAARATVRAGEAVISRCLFTSAEQTFEDSEQGLYVASTATLRYLLADDPKNGETAFGKRIAVTLANGTVLTMRIAGRTPPMGDVLRLTLEGITD